jgi:NAD(P)-dependent dehydrogenase (short-subunit alcohol dehydrogenase family)
MPSALVIGASRGLGLGMVREWQARGFDLVATRRGPAPELDATGAEVHVLDMDDTDAVAALAATLGARRFDVVLINAGISGPRDCTVQTVPRSGPTPSPRCALPAISNHWWQRAACWPS